MNVKLTAAQKIKVFNSDDVYKVMQQVLLRENKIRRGQEHFWIVGLNNQNKILFVELLSLGTQKSTEVSPPDVFRMAIYKLASKAVLVHNHPSGEVKPSWQDEEVTDKLLKAGRLLEIEIVDHLIITETTFYSFTYSGLLEKFAKSNSYVIRHKDEVELERLQTDAMNRKKIEEEVAYKEERIAERMLIQGMDAEDVSAFTGIKLSVVKNLLKKSAPAKKKGK